MSNKFKIKDLVMARMSRYPPWPGIIAEPPSFMPAKPASKKDKDVYCIFFFGSRNYSWCDDVKPYVKDSKEDGKKPTKSFLQAVEEIEKYIETGDETLIFPEATGEKSKPKPKKKDVAGRKSIAVINAKRLSDVNLPAKARSASPSQPGPSTEVDESATPFVTPKPVKERKKSKEGMIKRKMITPLSDPKKKKMDASLTEAKKKNKGTPLTDSKKKQASTPSTDLKKKKTDQKPKEPKVSLKQKRKSTLAAANQPTSEDLDSTADSIIQISQAMQKLLDPTIPRQASPPLDVLTHTDNLKTKNISPTSARIGFIGLGSMGCGLVKNLLNSGHTVVIWNRTPDKADIFMQAGATYVPTPHDVAETAEIIFSCVSDIEAATTVVYGNCGILNAITSGKSYIEMTSITPEYSEKLSIEISAREGRYVSLMMQGDRQDARDGSLVLLASGDDKAYNEIQSCLHTWSCYAYYLGQYPSMAPKVHLVLQSQKAFHAAVMAEVFVVYIKEGIDTSGFVELLDNTPASGEDMRKLSNFVLCGKYSKNGEIRNLRNQVCLYYNRMCDSLRSSVTLTATHCILEDACELGYGAYSLPALLKYNALIEPEIHNKIKSIRILSIVTPRRNNT